MLQIEDTLISLDVIEKKFSCNLSRCKGMCCLNGDSGAPLDDFEIKILEIYYPVIKPYMCAEGIEVIDKSGVYIIDVEFEKVTPLINGKDCAFSYMENDIYLCAIEQAHRQGVIDFQKPISCHLYPIRIKKHKTFDAVNYDKWDICKSALDRESHKGQPLYLFLKDALIRKYGEDWFHQLDYAAKNLKINKL